jgi:spermidine/putrescine-binding protein
MIRQLTIIPAALLLLASAAFSQDTKLVEAAKKESGAIIAYGSMEQAQAEPIIDAFQKKTGLKVEYWRASATKAMDRALTEMRAGKHSMSHDQQQRRHDGYAQGRCLRQI